MKTRFQHRTQLSKMTFSLGSIVGVLLISVSSWAQESRSEVIQLLETKVQEILPWNWYCVKTDTSVTVYFCRTAMNHDPSDKHTVFPGIDDSTLYGNEFAGQPAPDSVHTGFHVRGSMKSKKTYPDRSNPNNILRIDVILASEKVADRNSKFYDFPILIKESVKDQDLVVYEETVTPKKPYYDEHLGRELIREYHSLLLSINYLAGIDKKVKPKN